MSPLDLDAQLTRDIAGLDLPWLTPLMVLASAWWLKAFAFAGLAALGRAPARRRAASVLVVGLATALGGLASDVVKSAVARVRPPADIGLHALVAVPHSYSFPSGHATTAAAGATALALVGPRWRALGAALALTIAFSRVYLGVHFVGDVLAGLLLGAAVGTLTVLAARRLSSRRSASRTPAAPRPGWPRARRAPAGAPPAGAGPAGTSR